MWLGCRSRFLRARSYRMVVRGSAWRGGDLHVTQVDAGVEHGGDEGVPQHVRMHPALRCARRRRGRSPAQPRAATGRGRSWRPLPTTRSTRWPCSSPRSVTSVAQASKIRKPSRPSVATRAKSLRLVDSRAVVSSASNCRWVRPRVGDSRGTVGRRSHCARGVLQQPVDDAGAVEPAHHRGPPGDRGRLEPADLLAPAHVQLQVRPLRGQRVQLQFGAPDQEDLRSDPVWSRDSPR
jgi:hypothetical protein